MGKPMHQVLDDISRTYNSVQECMEDSREKSIVLTKLDEARLWAIEYCVKTNAGEKGKDGRD